MSFNAPLLAVRDLSVAFHQGGKSSLAVDRVSFALERGKTLAFRGHRRGLRAELRRREHIEVNRVGAAMRAVERLQRDVARRVWLRRFRRSVGRRRLRRSVGPPATARRCCAA